VTQQRQLESQTGHGMAVQGRAEHPTHFQWGEAVASGRWQVAIFTFTDQEGNQLNK